ncbi:uncharacterized protein PHACADRAFT_262325 [Phanerochaete carnosa HHB-10118-sp]|uniref:Uncharacterized protein n=1 Tax=Phanerochaete carnosa (strain HHB-10118-sp) TaxID=650164 RepID=K5VKJ7_PHACS|nr:uncharacterized protein PHACADRAFT_262325 [Phanerochaete carnosa HHB-10118-sp]EKM51913.1 hypothetical protein PHACADRAFT_262325 [Phanerochaete carnosa HHB-10118-sp]
MSDVVFSPDPNSDSDELSAPRRAQSDPRWLKALEVSAFPSTLSLGLMSPTAAPISPAVSTSPTRTRATPAGSPKRERSEQELLDVVTLGKPEPKPAFDPRDHRLLEYIYNEMHALRFINLEPIAVITNAMSLIFREVVTHPPVILAFPPVSTNPATCAGATKGKQDEHGSATSDLSTHADEHSPLISFAQVAAGGSPYVRFDYDRVTRRHPRGVMIIGSDSDSTSEKNSSLPSRPSAPLPPVHELVPLAGLTFDHRSLNMHLHLRVKEVLSCAEAMWQFVLDYQERNLDGARPRSAQGQGQGQGQGQRRGRMRLRKNREFHEDLVQLHRREFDAMLTRYRLDMEEHTLLTNSVHSRLSWPHVRSPKPPERVEFEELCEKWEKHLAETASTQTQLDHGHSNSLTSGSTFSELSITSTPASEASSEYATSQPGHAIPEGRIAASAKPFQESKDPAGCPSRTPHPSERTSRTFRTIVAWK